MRFLTETSRCTKELARWRSFWHLPYPTLAPAHPVKISASPASITCVLPVGRFFPILVNSHCLCAFTWIFFFFQPRVRKILSMLSAFSKQIIINNNFFKKTYHLDVIKFAFPLLFSGNWLWVAFGTLGDIILSIFRPSVMWIAYIENTGKLPFWCADVQILLLPWTWIVCMCVVTSSPCLCYQ